MKVLLVVPNYPSVEEPYAGIFIHEQLKAIKRMNPKIYIEVVKIEPYVPKLLSKIIKKYQIYENMKDIYVHDGISVNIIRVLSLPKNLFMAFKCRRTAIKLQKYLKLNNTKFDIIHAHGAVHTGFSAVYNSKQIKNSSIVTVHGSDIMFYPDLNKRMKNTSEYTLKNANSIIAASFGLKDAIIKRNGNVEVDVIYTGVDLKKFKIKQMTNNDSKVTKFIYVGNLLISKGIYDLVKAFGILRTRGINCSLTICGEGKEKRDVQEYCSLNNINSITFHGVVNNDDLPSILTEHDVLVLPSHREGLGMVLIEALAMGKLVIGSNVGGIPEVIEDKINGFLFNAMCIDDLANVMEKAALELPRINPQELRATVENTFDIDKNALKIINKYEEILRG